MPPRRDSYTQTRHGRILQGQVYHRPYPLRAVTKFECQESLSTAAGITLATPPCHAIFSPGVRVQIFGLREVLRVGDDRERRRAELG